MVRRATVSNIPCTFILIAWIALGVLFWGGRFLPGAESDLVRLPPVDSPVMQTPELSWPLELSLGERISRRENREAPSALPLEVIQPNVRSLRLEQAAKQADLLTLEGYELAGRGALFAARAEFRAALVVLAQALDAEKRTSQNSQMLAAAWVALKEAEDFLPQGGNLVTPLNLSEIVARHDSPVLKDHPLHLLTPLEAYQIYLNFAQDLLSRAVASEITGSMALRGLGKIYAEWKGAGSLLQGNAESQAMVFYQAALNVWPENYMAANDLGVLLARGERWEDAACVLEYARRIKPNPTILANLSKVYRQTGQTYQTPQILADLPNASPLGDVTRDSFAQNVAWVPPEMLGHDGCVSDRTGEESRPAKVGAAANGGLTASAAAATGLRFPALPFFKSKTGTATPPESQAPVSDYQSGNISTGYQQVLQPQIAHADLPRGELVRGDPANGVPLPNPASPCPRCAVDGAVCDPTKWGGWNRARMITWEKFAQGEYIGRARLAHVPEYRLRVDDELQIVYRITREETSRPYRLNVGDQLKIESATDPSLNREVLIQPDGTITLLLLGQVKATGLTVAQLRDSLEQLYRRYYRVPAITVTPVSVNSKLEDLRATVDRRNGDGGQSQNVRVTPEGTIALPGLGSVTAQGLTLRELQAELNERYREEVEGIEAMPILVQRAPRYVYVLGEVETPGRFELTGPTTVIQAISMAGGWKIGANLRQVVVFRRGDDWRLMATMIDLQAALHGNKATPRDEIWLSDSDVVIVPKSFIQRSDDFIEMVFTRGIYGVFPLQTTINFSKLSTI